MRNYDGNMERQRKTSIGRGCELVPQNEDLSQEGGVTVMMNISMKRTIFMIQHRRRDQ